MKVLYISNIPTPYTDKLFFLLSKKCDLTVLYELKKAKNRDAIWTKTNEPSTYKRHFLKGIRVNEETGFNPSIIKWLRGPYDVIVTGYASLTGILTFEYLRLKKKQNFVFKADGGLIKNDNKTKFLVKKHFISNAPYYLSSGRKTTEYLIHYGADANHIVEYPFTSFFANDIRKTTVSQEEKNYLRQKNNIKEKTIVLSIGQFIYRKGFDLLIKAANNVDKDIGIYIVGGEPPLEYIKLKEKLQLVNVHFLPFKTGRDLADLYETSDIFVLPTREDIWGLVINEAMAYGLPVITTNKCVAGLELIVDDINGYIIEVDNVDQLSEKIKFLVNNKEKRIEMGNQSLIKIKDYTIENVVNKHVELFSKIINQKLSHKKNRTKRVKKNST